MNKPLCIVVCIFASGVLGMVQPTLYAAEGAAVSVRALGATGDGATDDTAFFQEALDTIGERSMVLLVADGVFAVQSLVIPPNVTLTFRDNGRLEVAEGHTVTVNGRIEAAISHIFSGAGDVNGQVDNLHIFPQWFGAAADGVQDDARPLQQAADLAADSLGRTLFVPEGVYRFTRNISLRCNVESRGLFVIVLEVDDDRTQFCNDLFLPTHHPKNAPIIRIAPDHEEQELAMAPFFGIEEGDSAVPVYSDVPLADGSGVIDLEEGGVLRFYSSDFFSSRRVRKGAHYYDRNDISQMVSGRGAVFPEFAFSYHAPPDAEEWNENTNYVKADYCVVDGEVFKATWPSGPGASFEHRHLGAVDIGAVPPEPGRGSTTYHFTYEDGTDDSILLWRRVRTQVWYRAKDVPVTVNGLRIEVRLKDHGGETKRLAAGAMTVNRSNVTFNNLEISVRDREATMSRLLQSTSCVNNTFNNGYFSGATSAHLGYNILNSNVANFRYNHCISTNSRKGMDGRHGKNMHVVGGYYNIIDDHYGRNYVIRDITLSGLSVHVPGDSTPDADLQGWIFRPRTALSFNGANFHIENITLEGGAGSLMSARGDIGDLYGAVTLRDVTVRGNNGDIQLFRHSIDPDFDYAHDVKVPSRLQIENVLLKNPGGVRVTFGSGFDERTYGPVYVRNATVTEVFTASPDTTFSECVFDNARFTVTEAGRISFRQCIFAGQNRRLEAESIAVATGNVMKQGAACSFPIEHVNETLFEQP